MDTYLITAIWDAEAGVWVAESDDVPGLVTGAPTLDELVAKLHALIPELIELNGGTTAPRGAFELRASKDHEQIRLYVNA